MRLFNWPVASCAKEITPDQVRLTQKAQNRREPSETIAMAKACGVAEFSAILKWKAQRNCVSTVPCHARIKSIHTAAAEKMPGVIGL